MARCKNCDRRSLKRGYDICQTCWNKYAHSRPEGKIENEEVTPKGNIICYVGDPWTGDVERTTLCPEKYLVVYDDEYLPSRFEIEKQWGSM